MSSLLSDVDIVAIIQQYMIYFYIIILIFGCIGNILIILIFTNLKVFHRNQYSFYLSVESLINIAAFICSFIDRITQYPDGCDLADYSIIWCETKTILTHMSQIISFFTVCYAAFDQILSTSHQYIVRQMSTYKLAQYLIFIIICLAIIHSSPIIFLYGLFPPIGCTSNNEILMKYFTYVYFPILIGIFPIFISSLFSLIAFRNVRHIIRRQIPIIRRKLDRQLTAMILIRVVVFVVLYLPYVTYRIYTLRILITTNYNVPFLFDQIMQRSVILLKDINYSIVFYIFLITSPRFRRQVKFFLNKKCFHQWKNRFHSSHNRIHPIENVSMVSIN